jgi:hypothetical protein
MATSIASVNAARRGTEAATVDYPVLARHPAVS